MVLRDAVAFAIGTLTRLPVPPPSTVDRRVAGSAMLLSPLVGVGLGVVVGGVAQVLADHTHANAVLVAALSLAALAYLTRAIHLDGLADTADALGSGRPAAEALAIARRSDIGPFGVVTLIVVLLIQVAALAQLIGAGIAPLGLVIALVAGRLVLGLACLRGVPAARPDGLGAAVAGSVSPAAFVAVTAGWGLACAALAAVMWQSIDPIRVVATVVTAIALTLIAAAVVIRTANRRLGGITGDVLGAVIEIGTTTAIVILVIGL